MLQCLQACNLPKQREQHSELSPSEPTLLHSDIHTVALPHACNICEVWKYKAKGLRHQVVRAALCGFELSVLYSLGRVFCHMSWMLIVAPFEVLFSFSFSFFLFMYIAWVFMRVYCAIALWFEVCLVLYCVVDSNHYQLSCPGSSVGRALA